MLRSPFKYTKKDTDYSKLKQWTKLKSTKKAYQGLGSTFNISEKMAVVTQSNGWDARNKKLYVTEGMEKISWRTVLCPIKESIFLKKRHHPHNRRLGRS